MASESYCPESRLAEAAKFKTTHWSVVLAATKPGTQESAAAMETLCRSYWYPLYSFLRRQGYSAPDAQDFTQSFFAHLLAKDALKRVDRRHGKFRSFLLASLKNAMANEWDKQQALKRGGQFSIISIDAEVGEERFCREPSHEVTPDKAFEQSWAIVVLEGVLERLQREYLADDKAALFNALQPLLSGDKGVVSYADVARQLNMTEGAVKMAVLRSRRRFGELLRAEIANTVTRPEEINEEIRTLFAAVSL